MLDQFIGRYFAWIIVFAFIGIAMQDAPSRIAETVKAASDGVNWAEKIEQRDAH